LGAVGEGISQKKEDCFQDESVQQAIWREDISRIRDTVRKAKQQPSLRFFQVFMHLDISEQVERWRHKI
jgi:hypothetical protein